MVHLWAWQCQLERYQNMMPELDKDQSRVFIIIQWCINTAIVVVFVLLGKTGSLTLTVCILE